MLRPYTPEDLKLLQTWVTDADMLFQFSGTDFSYPITLQQVEQYQQKHPGRRFYIANNETGEPVAFGEIIPQEAHIPRLGRLIVGDLGNRRKSIGSKFILELIAECQRSFDAKYVELYVSGSNQVAIKCYEKLGFTFLPIEPFELEYGGAIHRIFKMRIEVK